MFGKLGDMAKMMSQLKEAQAKMEETKRKLDSIYLQGKSYSENVTVSATASLKITRVEIKETALMLGATALSEEVLQAVNDALYQAQEVQKAEMAAVAKDAMPNIPGLGNLT